MKIVSGSSHPDLAQKIASHLGAELVPVELSKFANDEKGVWIKGNVRGENVVLVQTLSKPVDENLVELLLLADALDRLGARHINVLMPWMGYSLQDKVFREGEPIGAKVVANLISAARIKRCFVIDLHNSSTPGFFSVPTQHLTAQPLFVEYVKAHFSTENLVVASPDFGGLKRAGTFAEDLGVELVNLDKERDLHTRQITHMVLHGNVQGKDVLLFDDVINSGSTVVICNEVLKHNGAKSVHFLSTHGLFANNGWAKIEASSVDSVVVTNSIPQQASGRLQVIDLSQMCAEAIGAWK